MEMHDLPEWIQNLWDTDPSSARKAEALYKDNEQLKDALSTTSDYADKFLLGKRVLNYDEHKAHVDSLLK